MVRHGRLTHSNRCVYYRTEKMIGTTSLAVADPERAPKATTLALRPTTITCCFIRGGVAHFVVFRHSSLLSCEVTAAAILRKCGGQTSSRIFKIRNWYTRPPQGGEGVVKGTHGTVTWCSYKYNYFNLIY